jgi:hypothetical protein
MALVDQDDVSKLAVGWVVLLVSSLLLIAGLNYAADH